MKTILLFIIAVIVSASQLTFPVHRMIQFQRKGIEYGSQKNNGELRFASLSSILNLEEDARIKADHYTALVMMNELSVEVIVSLVDQNEVGGLVIIIPKTTDAETIQKCKEVEQYMLQRSFACPVYFIEEDNDVMTVYNSLQSRTAALSPSNIYTMSVSFPRNNKPIALPEIRTIESIIEGFKEGTPVASLPSIVVAASYDAFAAAPSLSKSRDDGASGTVAVLEIARLFSHLYTNQKTVGTYNLMFVVSGGSHIDYEGFRQWMIRSNADVLKNVQFVLCLDELSTSDHLTLHLSKQTTDAELLRFYSAFTSVAKEMNVPFTITNEAVDIMKEYRVYPHERFALRRMMAVTISGIPLSIEMSPYLSGSVFSSGNDDNVIRNTKLVAEALARYMFNLDNAGFIFENSLAIETEYIKHWMALMNETPRNALIIKKDDIILTTIENELKNVCNKVNLIDSEMDLKDNIKIFADNSADVAVFISKSPLFDVYTFLSVIGYLIVLYIAIAISHEGIDVVRMEVKRFFATNFGWGVKEKEN